MFEELVGLGILLAIEGHIGTALESLLDPHGLPSEKLAGQRRTFRREAFLTPDSLRRTWWVQGNG
ncbi:unnamed protein product [Mycena citricolor]|uniref:Uncharacterized protein n=1 Tax=Mycena citricolor TaxID=2018698 RepID=A0AAD2HPG2_9AGAR|nr:unnamed protein product [Mycena citricolor]